MEVPKSVMRKQVKRTELSSAHRRSQAKCSVNKI